jgi:hypothetical protein
MPALWPVFEGQLNQWFNGFAEGGDQTSYGADTAAQIASAYDKALKTATIVGKGNLLTPSVIIPSVEAGFASCFAMMAPSPVDLSIAPYMLAANGVVATWGPAQYNPLPPHLPDVLPLVGVIQLFPGAPMPLAKEIMDAFTQEDAGQIAPKLKTAFANHMKQIFGIYLGLMPNPAPPPPLIPAPAWPWSGVE